MPRLLVWTVLLGSVLVSCGPIPTPMPIEVEVELGPVVKAGLGHRVFCVDIPQRWRRGGSHGGGEVVKNVLALWMERNPAARVIDFEFVYQNGSMHTPIQLVILADTGAEGD